MNTVQLDELFTIKRGNDLVLQDLVKDKQGINYVARSARNNGIVCRVAPIPSVQPNPPGTITVALSGSVMSAFLQTQEYYTGDHIAILTPKQPLSEQQMLYYCLCIRQNKYKYNYGRQANRTLYKLMVPALSDIPNWVNNTPLPDYSQYKVPVSNKPISLDTSMWKPFKYSELFNIMRGQAATIEELGEGSYPYISATSLNNGISGYVSQTNAGPNCITVSINGSIGEAFFQPQLIFANSVVAVLTLKDRELTPAISLFLTTLIRKEKYRYNYGRKWSLARMNESIIKLPVCDDGTPDWQWMEQFMLTLPYSKVLV